jgi:hypothetical protein
MTNASTTSLSTMLSVRVPNSLMAQIDAKIARLTETALGCPPTRSQFVLCCITEVLEKASRAKRSRDNRRKRQVGDGEGI